MHSFRVHIRLYLVIAGHAHEHEKKRLNFFSSIYTASATKAACFSAVPCK